MKSTIELARESLGVNDGDDYYAYEDKEHFWGEAKDLERFAALLKAEWLKEAGEMPEPAAWRYHSFSPFAKNREYPVSKRWTLIDKPGQRDAHSAMCGSEVHPLVTVAQCQQAVAAAVARKDAEIARLTAACNKFSEDEMLLTLTAERDALKALVSQQLTTEQVQRAKQALYEASHGDLEATDDEVKAAISVDLPYVWP